MVKWKHIQEGLDHKHLREIATNYISSHRNYKYKLVEEPEKQCNEIYIDKKIAIKLIMDCRTTSAHKARLGFKQDDVILTKEQSVLTKIMS